MKVAKTLLRKNSYGEDTIKAFDENIRQIDTDLNSLFTALQGRIRFGSGSSGARGENVSGGFLSITTSASSDTESTHAHGLGATPIGYIVLSKDKAAHIYDGDTSWDATNIYLKSDGTSVTALLFILK